MSEISGLMGKDGFSFEVRCEGAREHLRGIQALFLNITSSNQLHQHKQGQDAEKFLRDPSLSDTERERLQPLIGMFPAMAEFLTTHTHEYLSRMWEEGLRFSREFYGDDATEFALEILKRKGNAN